MIGERVNYFGGTTFIAGQTANGMCFKDSGAFDRHSGICYIPEYAFDEAGKVKLDAMNISGTSDLPMYTYMDIWGIVDREVINFLVDIEISERPSFVAHVTELVFQEIDWQSPSTYLGELDLDEIYADWKGDKSDNQSYLRDLLIQDLMNCEPQFTRKIATTIVNEMPYADILKRWDIEHVRVCSVCGKLMNDGYCEDAGAAYYCSNDCLHTAFTDEEWKAECEANDQSYYTEWN